MALLENVSGGTLGDHFEFSSEQKNVLRDCLQRVQASIYAGVSVF